MFVDNSDLIVIALDIIDCDIKNTKFEKLLVKHKSDKSFLFILTKSDMFDSQEEINDQIIYVTK